MMIRWANHGFTHSDTYSFNEGSHGAVPLWKFEKLLTEKLINSHLKITFSGQQWMDIWILKRKCNSLLSAILNTRLCLLYVRLWRIIIMLNLILIRSTKAVSRQRAVPCNATLDGCLHGQIGVSCAANKLPPPPSCRRRDSTRATIARIANVARECWNVLRKQFKLC